MRHLPARTSIIGASLCVVVILGVFLLNNAGRSQAHAERSTSGAQSTAKKASEPVHSADGSVAWQTSTSTTPISSLAATNGVTYASSEDAVLYAFNASTGTLLWRQHVG